MADFIWEDWQNKTIDSYLLGFTLFETQQDLSKYLGKNINSVKIKLTRRRKELEEEKRKLNSNEYITFLANRFSMSTKDIAAKLHVTEDYLLDELDELDCLECKEYLVNGFQDREMTNDEYELFLKMYKNKKTNQYIAHFLNRKVTFIQELIKEYECI